jgi:hypothetical protein
MNDSSFDLKEYRQPLVTSLGVILGFLLGFLGQWITEDNFTLDSLSDHLTFAGSIVGAALLLYALFRMLVPGIKPDAAHAYYARTLRLFMAGVLVPLVSILIAAFV